MQFGEIEVSILELFFGVFCNYKKRQKSEEEGENAHVEIALEILECDGRQSFVNGPKSEVLSMDWWQRLGLLSFGSKSDSRVLCSDFAEWTIVDSEKKTHFFDGEYSNLYCEQSKSRWR